MRRSKPCEPDDDVCTAHSLPLATGTMCEDGIVDTIASLKQQLTATRAALREAVTMARSYAEDAAEYGTPNHEHLDALAKLAEEP